MAAKIVVRAIGIVLSIAIIVSGIVIAPMLFRIINAESYINGELNVRNEFSVDNFYYASNNLTFYNDDYAEQDRYYFNVDLVKVTDFNGLEGKYSIVLNEYPLLDNTIDAGRLQTSINIDFLNVENQVIQTAKMNIKIEFFANRSALSFTTQTLAEATFLSSYFNSNGLRLAIDEIV